MNRVKKGNQRELDASRIERDILEVANQHGMMGPESGKPAYDALAQKYGDHRDIAQRITAVMQYLMEERYLFPLFDSEGRESRLYARGITPKGSERLKEIRHPIRTWMRKNWFPLAIAALTTTISVVSMVISLIINTK